QSPVGILLVDQRLGEIAERDSDLFRVHVHYYEDRVLVGTGILRSADLAVIEQPETQLAQTQVFRQRAEVGAEKHLRKQKLQLIQSLAEIVALLLAEAVGRVV